MTTDSNGEKGRERMAAALAPFGWTCTEGFWQRYHSDPWVFNLANAVDRLADQGKRDADLIGNLRRALYEAACSTAPAEGLTLDHEAGVAFLDGEPNGSEAHQETS